MRECDASFLRVVLRRRVGGGSSVVGERGTRCIQMIVRWNILLLSLVISEPFEILEWGALTRRLHLPVRIKRTSTCMSCLICIHLSQESETFQELFATTVAATEPARILDI
jgi:hypothetical protein